MRGDFQNTIKVSNFQSAVMNKPMIRLLSALAVLLVPLSLTAAEDRSIPAVAGKLDQWFTVDEAAKIAGKEASSAQVDYYRSEKQPITEVVEYAWKGDRKKMTTGALKMERPVADSIKVGWLRKASLQEMHDLKATTEGEAIEGVGEFAFLAKEGLQYIFFKNGVRFSVWVNLSNDPKVNSEHAMATARLLLEKL